MAFQIDAIYAQRLVRSGRCCADCWEALHVELLENSRDEVRLTCSTPGCPCRGHVSVRFVDNALAESRLKLAEAQRALGESGAVPWLPKPAHREAAEILAELGYR